MNVLPQFPLSILTPEEKRIDVLKSEIDFVCVKICDEMKLYGKLIEIRDIGHKVLVVYYNELSKTSMKLNSNLKKLECLCAEMDARIIIVARNNLNFSWSYKKLYKLSIKDAYNKISEIITSKRKEILKPLEDYSSDSLSKIPYLAGNLKELREYTENILIIIRKYL